MIELSPDQVAACSVLEGPVRVVAGPGTGKTAVIAERYRRLVDRGVDPGAILVMTFTERAAAEMRQRIQEAAPAAATPHIGTFHALALGWLREDGSRIALRPGFRLLTGPDRWISMRERMWELGDAALIGDDQPDELVMPLLKLQERLKQELVPIERFAEWASRDSDRQRGELLQAAAGLFRAHARWCRRERVLDFDDLLAMAVRLLESHREVRERYRARFRWLMVDEYQDTNLAQERVVELLAGRDGNVCVVGDDDQSIYRFRGASRASLERFLASFVDGRTFNLEHNWRSSGPVVRAASELISHNTERLPKQIRSALDGRGCREVEVWHFLDGQAEASAIAAEVESMRAGGVPLGRIAVLARTHAITLPVLEALAQAHVPFVERGGRGLFQRPEVRDAVAYLRLLNDPTDLLALVRLVTRPGLSLNLVTVLDRIRSTPEDPPLRSLSGWGPTARWARILLELVPLGTSLDVQDLLFEVFNRTQHLERLAESDPQSAARTAANVGRFAELVADFCERRSDHSLSAFLAYLELVQLSKIDEDVAEPDSGSDGVQVMTIHQSKGLEFDAVFVPSVVEGRLPQPHRKDELEVPPQLVEASVRGRQDHLAEERRLLYVAMTRARSRLVLSWAERYSTARVWRPSRFLSDLGGTVHVTRNGREADGASAGAAAPGGPVAPAGAAAGDETGRGPSVPGQNLQLSFTAIGAYRECPRQHWYRYQARLPAKHAAEAQLGTVVHLVLMGAGRRRRQGGDVSLAFLRRLHRESWESVGPVDPRRRPALERLGWTMLEAWWRRGGPLTAPLLVEAPFTADLDGWTLRGVIDRVDELPPPTQSGGGWERRHANSRSGDGARELPPPGRPRYRIVDFKTGRPQPASRLRRDLQLALYAIGARSLLGIDDGDPLELVIDYLREGDAVVLEATDELVEEARRIGGEVATGVRAGAFEPRPERGRCSRCAYRLACDAAL